MTSPAADDNFIGGCSIHALGRGFARHGFAMIAEFCQFDLRQPALSGEVEDNAIQRNGKPALTGWKSAALPTPADPLCPPVNPIGPKPEPAPRAFAPVT